MNCILLIRIYLLIGILVNTGISNLEAQNTILFSADELNKANTAANIDYLSSDEKEVIRYLNLARMDGKRFFDSYIQQFIENYNVYYSPKIKPNNSYVKSLKATLYKVQGLSIIVPNEKLSKAAAFHAKDMGNKGKTGHTSSNGTSFTKRMKKLVGTEYYVSENCDYGFNNGLDIVCHLLIDNGVSSLGHRKNILNPDQRMVGVSIYMHKIYKYNCVMDFYCNNDNLK
jgi:hypothetical protein